MIDMNELLAWLEERIAECETVINENDYFWGQMHYPEELIDEMNHPFEWKRDTFQDVKAHLEERAKEIENS